jgi:ATP synthase subunit 6
MFIVFFYLYLLCDLKQYIPNSNYNVKELIDEEGDELIIEEFLEEEIKNEKLILKECSTMEKKELKSSIIEEKEIIKYDYYDLTLEASFIIYSFTDFVYNQILENLVYFKSIFLNYTLALFLFLLACNLFGMIPYSLTVTSYLILTLNLSGMSFFGNLLIALKIHRLKFFKFFIPNGVTGGLVVLMVVIELISYVARLFSMAIRLFANMLSGHALIKILSGLVFLSFSDIYFFGIINILFNTILLAVTALEVIVAALQSYVFVVLSVVYTNEAIVLH